MTAIADVPLHELTEHHLVQWRERRPAALAPATVKRIIIDLRAALNATAKTHRATLPADIAVTIKHGLSFSDASAPVARDGAALSDHDVRRVLDAAAEIDAEGNWDGDLLRLVTVLAATGARFQPDRPHPCRRLPDRAGPTDGADIEEGPQQRRQEYPYRVRIGADVVELLRPAAAGRKASELLLERWWHRQQGTRVGARQARPMD